MAKILEKWPYEYLMLDFDFLPVTGDPLKYPGKHKEEASAVFLLIFNPLHFVCFSVMLAETNFSRAHYLITSQAPSMRSRGGALPEWMKPCSPKHAVFLAEAYTVRS